MSSRVTLRPQTLFVNKSLASSFNATPTILGSMSGVSYDGFWNSSTAVGALSVQVSNSYSLNSNGTTASAGSWTTIPFTYNGSTVTSIPVTGSSGTFAINITGLQLYAVQLVYTFTSGSGSMTATVCGKVS